MLSTQCSAEDMQILKIKAFGESVEKCGIEPTRLLLFIPTHKGVQNQLGVLGGHH